MNLATATIDVSVPPETAFELFTTPSGLCRWMAVEAEVDLRPGGAWRWVHDNGAACSGTYLAVDEPRRLSFTYGWESGPFADVGPGSTRVDVDFEPIAGGTRVQVVHDGFVGDLVERHAAGWAHFLGVLAETADANDPPTTRGDDR